MTGTAVAGQAAASPRARLAVNRVLLVLVAAGLAAALGLAFVTVAPNRLVTGRGVGLPALLTGARMALLAPAACLALGCVLPPRRAAQALVALAAAALLAGLMALAGDEAARRSAEAASPLARVSLGGGFWVLALLCGLAASDALQRLALPAAARTLWGAAVWLPLLGLLLAGRLDALSLMKEYANRQDVFHDAALRHAQIVAATLLPAVLIGVPLGWAASRWARLRTPLLGLLGVVQTIPSIALFGLLMAPLAALALALPGWGISGIGLLPAVLALTLYALLPIVHGTLAGLQQVPAALVEAATGMGMTSAQRLARVELPLALPVLVSALRVALVQVIGLAVVAALIGAGGFGALVFQGLASSALDLVLLGVLPTVALAAAADAAMQALTAWATRRAAP